MKVGGMLRVTVVLSAVLAALAVAGAAALGSVGIGVGLGAGLLVGSLNGHLVLGSLQRRVPFVAASVSRMVVLSAAGILVATLLGSYAWSVLLGVAAAQFVMVGAAVRQGMRA